MIVPEIGKHVGGYRAFVRHCTPAGNFRDFHSQAHTWTSFYGLTMVAMHGGVKSVITIMFRNKYEYNWNMIGI